MSTKRLNIPQDLNLDVEIGDCLFIAVVADCTWCYAQPNPPPFPKGLLPPGSYKVTNPHTVYGPYCAVSSGTVPIGAVTSGKCTPGYEGKIETGHSIVVS